MVKLTPWRKPWLNSKRQPEYKKPFPDAIREPTVRSGHPLRRKPRLAEEEPDDPEEDDTTY